MIVLGAGRPIRNSLGLFLPRPPRRQVFPFTSLGVRGGYSAFRPPVVLCPPQDPQGLLVLEDRVDAWLRLPASTSHTGSASSPPQKRSCHSPSRPNSLWDSGMCKCRPPQCMLRTPLRWYYRKKWQMFSVRGISTPFPAALSIAVQILNPALSASEGWGGGSASTPDFSCGPASGELGGACRRRGCCQCLTTGRCRWRLGLVWRGETPCEGDQFRMETPRCESPLQDIEVWPPYLLPPLQRLAEALI